MISPDDSPHASELPLHRSCDERGGRRRDVLEGSRQGLHALVVPREAVDAALHEDKPELAVLVLAVLVQVLPNGNGLLDQEVEVLGEAWREPVGLQDAQDLAAGHVAYERDAEAVAERYADLRRSEALLRQLADVVADVFRLHLDPC